LAGVVLGRLKKVVSPFLRPLAYGILKMVENVEKWYDRGINTTELAVQLWDVFRH
jgi:hypothetical protein